MCIWLRLTSTPRFRALTKSLLAASTTSRGSRGFPAVPLPVHLFFLAFARFLASAAAAASCAFAVPILLRQENSPEKQCLFKRVVLGLLMRHAETQLLNLHLTLENIRRESVVQDEAVALSHSRSAAIYTSRKRKPPTKGTQTARIFEVHKERFLRPLSPFVSPEKMFTSFSLRCTPHTPYRLLRAPGPSHFISAARTVVHNLFHPAPFLLRIKPPGMGIDASWSSAARGRCRRQGY